MPTADSPLILYGVPFSQPVRAVLWLLLHQRLPFEMVLINPGSAGDNGSRNPAYLAKSPGGTIPCIEEPDTGFMLSEAHAIMAYLCNRHGWAALYPQNPQQRALVDWYLHFHHRNVREASVGLVAPRIRKDLNIPEAAQRAAAQTLSAALQALDQGVLARTEYIAGAAHSIADFAAYVEIGQLQPCFTNLFDFGPYPNVQRWLTALQSTPGHDAVHTVLAELGDISTNAPSMETIKTANKRALAALKEQLATFS